MKSFTTYFIPALVALLFSSVQVFAQSGNSTLGRGGSVYSSIGVGGPADNTSSGLKSQGILGITSIGNQTSGLTNPALWALSPYTQASTALDFTNTKVSDNSGSERNFNLQTGHLHLVLPIKSQRFGLSLALYPSTRASFKTTNTGTFESSSPSETVIFVNEIQRNGGVNKLETGFGIKIGSNISIGYAPSFAFLSIDRSENIEFDTFGFDTYFHEYQTTGVGFSQRFGLNASFDNIFSEYDRLSIGATLNLPYTLEAEQTYTSEKIVQGLIEVVDISDQLDNTEGDIEMPLEAAFGIGYAASPFVNVSFESQIQNWSTFNNELNPEDEGYYSDRLTLGIGGQYHPYRLNRNSFLSRFKYSAGLSYDTGHLTIDNQDITTFWINTGIGIPSRVASFVDFSLQYGFRGAKGANLYEERIWSFGLSVSLTELMFIRPKLR